MGERALLMVWGVTNEEEEEEEERPSESLGLVSVDILASPSPTSLSQSSQQPQPLSFNKSSKKTEDLLELLLASRPHFRPNFHSSHSPWPLVGCWAKVLLV